MIRHNLYEIDPEKMTATCAICGPTEIRKRKLLKKYTAYICATKKREYAREYRLKNLENAKQYHLKRFPPHPRIFSPSAHFLSEVDYVNKTAVCAQCGLVKIYVWRTKNTIGRRCSRANIQNSMAALQRRKESNGKLVNEYKVQHGCQRCGYNSDPLGLTLYRHIRNKEHETIIKKQLLFGRERLLKELKKYEVLCESCYPLVHVELNVTSAKWGN